AGRVAASAAPPSAAAADSKKSLAVEEVGEVVAGARAGAGGFGDVVDAGDEAPHQVACREVFGHAVDRGLRGLVAHTLPNLGTRNDLDPPRFGRDEHEDCGARLETGLDEEVLGVGTGVLARRTEVHTDLQARRLFGLVDRLLYPTLLAGAQRAQLTSHRWPLLLRSLRRHHRQSH